VDTAATAAASGRTNAGKQVRSDQIGMGAAVATAAPFLFLIRNQIKYMN
jgi:hypothetical protein